MTKEEANSKLAEMVSVAEAALSDCEKFADIHGLSFSWSPAYTMGGQYYSKKYVQAEGFRNQDSYGWRSSSEGC